jgi:hypothetical protein
MLSIQNMDLTQNASSVASGWRVDRQLPDGGPGKTGKAKSAKPVETNAVTT